jgi:hypothetical protein
MCCEGIYVFAVVVLRTRCTGRYSTHMVLSSQYLCAASCIPHNQLFQRSKEGTIKAGCRGEKGREGTYGVEERDEEREKGRKKKI